MRYDLATPYFYLKHGFIALPSQLMSSFIDREVEPYSTLLILLAQTPHSLILGAEASDRAHLAVVGGVNLPDRNMRE